MKVRYKPELVSVALIGLTRVVVGLLVRSSDESGHVQRKSSRVGPAVGAGVLFASCIELKFAFCQLWGFCFMK